MIWTVLNETDQKIKLVSKGSTDGILPKGSFLTVEDNKSKRKFILRVDESKQVVPYSPSPLLSDMDLEYLEADKKCKNEITAYRVKDVFERDDGMVDFIHPTSPARRSSQEEINLAMGMGDKGPKVFVSTVNSNQNRVLRDESGKHITATLPSDFFYHQTLICGKTGSGKTVAMKYLAQYFIEEIKGAVLAVNVKDIDFLQMDRASVSDDEAVLSEWKSLGMSPHGVSNVTMYMPANRRYESVKGINYDICRKITLDVNQIQPEALTGLLQGISDKGALNLPGIFRYWRQYEAEKGKARFTEFVKYFNSKEDSKRFTSISDRGEETPVTIHPGTYDNISRSLESAIDFFDNSSADSLDYDDVLQQGKMSILDFSGDKGPRFGSILLRDLLKKIVDAKDAMMSKVPILIIIDEVHQFYSTDSSREALDDIERICRTGRSKEIGVIFASQSIEDIPKGIPSVVNTQIFFKTDSSSLKSIGVKISPEELEGLRKGFAIASIHDLPQLKILKFPLSLCGVVKNE